MSTIFSPKMKFDRSDLNRWICNIVSAHSHRHDFFQPFVSSAIQHMYVSGKEHDDDFYSWKVSKLENIKLEFNRRFLVKFANIIRWSNGVMTTVSYENFQWTVLGFCTSACAKRDKTPHPQSKKSCEMLRVRRWEVRKTSQGKCKIS